MIEGLAKVLLSYRIIVNGIEPGPTATNMQSYKDGDSIYTDQTPLKRFTLPNEVEEFTLMLVSDFGQKIIGDTIYMSGGRGKIEKR